MRVESLKRSIIVAIGLFALQWPVLAQAPFEDGTTTPGANSSTGQTTQAPTTINAASSEVAIGQA